MTDLDSTNGTYINERRLNPGFPVPIDPGSLLIFGLDPTIPVQFINYVCSRSSSLLVVNCGICIVHRYLAGDIHFGDVPCKEDES